MNDREKQMENRDYKSGDLPTFLETSEPGEKLEISKVIYSEVNSNYRHLADTRFKLLGFVPAVSIIAWIELIGKITPINYQLTLIGLVTAILGLRVTYGIRVYDQRNDDLYDDLTSRGRKIEEEWKIHTGIFRGRKNGLKTDFIKKKINHRRGLSLIYSSVFCGWSLLVLWYMGNLVHQLILMIILT